MLGEQIEQKLKELRELCQLVASKETVHISFHLNSYGWNTEIQERTTKIIMAETIKKAALPPADPFAKNVHRIFQLF